MKVVVNKFLLLILSVLFVLSCLTVFAFSNNFSAKAQTVPNADEKNLLMPANFSEHLDLTVSAPKSAVYYNEGAIIIRDDNTLWIYNDNEYFQYKNLIRNIPSQIKLYNDRYLFINDDAALYYLDLNDLSAPPVALQYQGIGINCEYFYLNQNKLLTKFSNTIRQYSLDGLTVSSVSVIDIGATPKNQTPVAINEQGDVFFINSNNSKLFRRNSNGELKPFEVSGSITEIITTGNCVYFIMDKAIYKIEDENQPVKLEIATDKSFDLGNIKTPVYLSYNDNKLLISDAEIGAVSEFSIAGDKLNFTGYAIAKNKTAYNRLPLNANDVDLSGDKLSVFSDTNSLNVALGENFNAYSVYSFTHGTDKPKNSKKTTVDVLGNIYSVKEDGKLYKNDIELIADDGIVKLETDLFGNLFSCSGKFFRYFNTTTNGWVNILQTSKNIVSFTMDIPTQTVYYLLENSECVYKTTLNNASISTLKASSPITNKYSSAEKEFTAYQFKTELDLDKIPVYKVNYDGQLDCFNYVGEGEKNSEYAYIESTSFTGVNGQEKFIFLTDTKQTVLISEKFVAEKPIDYNTTPPKQAFVTMPVNAYYLPIITTTDNYALTNEGQKVRLSKEQKIIPLKTFTFLNAQYYYATFTLGETTIKAYVPVSFTVPVLAQDKAWSSYKLDNVKQCKLYSDAQLSQELISLAEKTEVKILNTVDGVCQVAVKTDDGITYGYLSEKEILNTPNATVTTILIVLAACASVCGSLTFFLLRKKKQ